MTYTLIVTTPGHLDLYGSRISEEEMVQIISKYPLHQILDLLAKIDILLNITAKGDEKLGKMQGEIIGAIFPPSVIARKHRKFPKDVNAFFSRGQINYLRKLAFTHCKFEDSEVRIWDDLKSKSVAKLFLGANDIFQDEVLFQEDESDEDILSFMVKSDFLNQEAEVKKKMGRAYLMFVEIKAKIEKYKDVDELLTEQLGLTALELISIGFALISPYFQGKDILHKASVTLNPTEYFKQLKIDPNKVSTVLELLSDDFETMKANVQSEGSISGYKIGTFTKKPLLKLEKEGEIRFFCLDVISLLDKFTLNLTWSVGNKNTLTDIMLSYRGSAFEEYLRRILKQYCKLRGSDLEFLYINNYGKNGNEELGDAILVDRKRKIAIVFEAKSKQFTDDVKINGDLDAIINSFVMPSDPIKNPKEEKGAAQQLDAAILKLKKDGLQLAGINPEGFRFFPIITFYDSLPSNDALNRYFQDIFRENKLYLDSDTFKAEIASISSIESLLQSDEDIIQILTRKHTTPQGEIANLQGFLYVEKVKSNDLFLENDLEEMFVKIKSNLGI